MLIDAHAHLDKYSDEEISGVLDTIDGDEIFTLSVSVDIPSFVRGRDIAARSPLIVQGFGVQPWEAPRYAHALDDLTEHAVRSPFIGEIGLDHRFVTDTDQYEAQRRVFARFLELAREQRKFVNVHCVGAELETAVSMRAHGIERAIIHWYSGPLDALAVMIDLGFMFTVGVELLHSDHIRDIARMIPIDQLLTETDNPGGPEWVTGERGQPGLIADVIETLTEVRGLRPAELLASVRTNMRRLIAGDEHMASWYERLSA